jgi:hypothetical protein
LKLLFCPDCSDVFKLSLEMRSCTCGKVRGQYLADGHHAVVNGEGYSLAIDNNSLGHMVRRHNRFGGCYDVTCYLRPHAGPMNPRTSIEEDL